MHHYSSESHQQKVCQHRLPFQGNPSQWNLLRGRRKLSLGLGWGFRLDGDMLQPRQLFLLTVTMWQRPGWKHRDGGGARPSYCSPWNTACLL